MTKTHFLFCAALLASVSVSKSFAQVWGTSSASTWTSGHVGIGMASAPFDAKLHIEGYVSNTMGGSDNVPEIKINRNGGLWMMCMGTPCPPPNFLEINATPWGYMGSTIPIAVIDPSGHMGISTGTPRASFDVNGNAIIGTSSIPVSLPAGYSLYVTKGILTEKVKVANISSADWSDYVFAKNYELMPLHSVASYIESNKHLPGIPSAEEVASEGLDLAKMDAKLLQKIEELTLYVIQQQKEIENQKAQINMLTKKLN